MAAAHRLNLPQLRREQQASGVCAPRTDLPPKSSAFSTDPRLRSSGAESLLVEEAGRPLLPSVQFFGVAELTTIWCTISSHERRGQLQSELRQGL